MQRVETGNTNLRDRDVAKGIDLVDSVDGGLDGRVRSRHVILNGCSQTAECAGQEAVDLRTIRYLAALLSRY